MFSSYSLTMHYVQTYCLDELIKFVLQGLMNTNKEDMRELAAQLYAVVVSSMSGNELRSAVQNLIKTTKDSHVRCKYLNVVNKNVFYIQN